MDPPPPPPMAYPQHIATVMPQPAQPRVPLQGPPGARLLELLTYNGAPFHDHWAFFLTREDEPATGDRIHAKGDVRVGFEFQIERGVNLQSVDDPPSRRIPLQWVEGQHIELEGDAVDHRPVSRFENCVHEITVPVKSLLSISEAPVPRRRVVQRDCQTWIVEAADKLVEAGMLKEEVAVYLHSIQQH